MTSAHSTDLIDPADPADLRGAPPRGRGRWSALRRPSTHWFVFGVALIVLLLMLVTDTVLSAVDGAAARGAPVLADPDRTGPVLDLSGSALRSGRGDGPSVGLAIAGLPDQGSTTALLRLLNEHRAEATWFVFGRDVVERGGTVAQIVDAGHEIGVTGYADGDLRAVPAWRVGLELSVTQAALAARVGRSSPLLLLPETPTRATLDAQSLRTARTAADRGYLLVAGTAPGAVEPGGVAVVMGPSTSARAEVAALLDRPGAGAGDRLGGVRSVSDAVGIDPAVANPEPPGWTRANGWLIVGAVVMSNVVARAIEWSFFPIMVLVGVRAALAVVLGTFHARRTRRRRTAADAWTGRVAVIVPAYNEAAGIAATVRSLRASSWDHGLDIIVVDDGSTDETAAIVEGLDVDGLTLIRQENAGKPAALNTGIAACSAEVVVLVDGDTMFQADTITELVAPFASPSMGAVSGNAKVANRSSLLGRWQHIEYVMGFNLDRRLLDVCNAIATVPGAVGAFRRSAVIEAGGVSDDTIAEDTDLTLALHRAGWRVSYEPAAIAWTEAPSSAGDLWKQRYRWSYGVLQSVWKHRRAVLEGHTIGTIGIPYALVFQVILGALAPIVDVAALHALVTGSYGVVWAWAMLMGLQMVLAAFAFRLDRESWRPLWAVPLQQVFYRQLMYLVIIQSLAAAAAGARLRWHKLHRVGVELPAGERPRATADR